TGIEKEILAGAQPRRDRFLQPVPRNQPKPRRHGPLRRGQVKPPPVQHDIAVMTLDPENRPGDAFLPRAAETGEAENLAVADIEGYRPHGPGAQPPDLREGPVRPRARSRHAPHIVADDL